MYGCRGSAGRNFDATEPQRSSAKGRFSRLAGLKSAQPCPVLAHGKGGARVGLAERGRLRRNAWFN
jgi:hypothetical protein